MLLHCLRHGVTEANLAGRFNGTLDDPLAEAQRGELVQMRFDSSPYDAIYCSPLTRSVETAQCLSIPDWIAEPRIAERNLGIFEGLTPQECQIQFAGEYASFLALDSDFEIPKGESRAQNLARVLSWLEEASLHGKVLAITHGGTIDFLYRLGSDMLLHGGDRIYGGDNASLSRFDVDWPNVRLIDYSVPLDA